MKVYLVYRKNIYRIFSIKYLHTFFIENYTNFKNII